MSLTVTSYLCTTPLVITCIRQEDEIKANKKKNDQTSLLVLMEPKSKQTEIAKRYGSYDMCKAYKRLQEQTEIKLQVDHLKREKHKFLQSKSHKQQTLREELPQIYQLTRNEHASPF